MDNENPGFRFLKDAFAKFAQKYKGDDMSARLIRSVAAGGKAAVDQSRKEFPKTFIGGVAKDLYSLLTSQEVADGISAAVQGFDEEKIQGLLDKVLEPLKDPDMALELVRNIKQATTDPDAAVEGLEKMLNSMVDKMIESRPEAQQDMIKGVAEKAIKSLTEQWKKSLEESKGLSLDDWMNQIEGMVGMIPGMETLTPIIFMQIRPIVDNMKDASDEEIAEQVVELVGMIPTDILAQMAAAYTREITPERISKQAHDVVGKLPSPSGVADIVHGVADVASQQFDKAANIDTPADVQPIIAEFTQNAKDAVKDILDKDAASKKTFDKKGGSFDL